MSKLSAEIAKKEALKWLASTGKLSISVTDKAEQANFTILVEAFMDGRLVLAENGELVQTLTHPIGEKEVVKNIAYKNRLKAREISNEVSSMENPGWDARLIGYISALTRNSSAIIDELSHVDYKFASAVAYFFM